VVWLGWCVCTFINGEGCAVALRCSLELAHVVVRAEELSGEDAARKTLRGLIHTREDEDVVWRREQQRQAEELAEQQTGQQQAGPGQSRGEQVLGGRRSRVGMNGRLPTPSSSRGGQGGQT
jgi:hypothetical protein